MACVCSTISGRPSVILKKNLSVESLIDGRHANTACHKMQLTATYVLEACRVGRSSEEHSELLDSLHIGVLVFNANFRIVMSSIMRRRNGLIASSVMGMLLF
jgi:hypothetical protein